MKPLSITSARQATAHPSVRPHCEVRKQAVGHELPLRAELRGAPPLHHGRTRVHSAT
eukprot:CAMPEP_0206011104 /NCGR_PEP_ID=MMETSP1464-20131121/12717_1 /ASSEMBLY_ACC=CAM_ASM_001124 /TAXON_ID=119497 /ORGANISM="Exanthemachrysis gayraliae, Strain RCC1523" /LENGTH=56 /DNA_ID=CAMNT_0053384757 /DNA_START=1 /DNA_END=171 /DNA_ORIENTATION=-